MRKISLTLKAATQEDLNVAICLRFAGFATLRALNVANCQDSAGFATLEGPNVADCLSLKKVDSQPRVNNVYVSNRETSQVL